MCLRNRIIDSYGRAMQRVSDKSSVARGNTERLERLNHCIEEAKHIRSPKLMTRSGLTLKNVVPI